MLYLIVKIFFTAIIIAVISEIARRSSLVAGILASIPLTSALALTWLYFDTKNLKNVIDLSNSVLLLIPPSLTFFLILPMALKKMDFIYSLFLAILSTAVVYWIYIFLLSRFGVRL